MSVFNRPHMVLVTNFLKSLTKNQLSQCSGGEYDRINEMLQEVEDRETSLEDDDDDEDGDNSKKRRLIEQYRTYLERSRKQIKIMQRAENISTELKSKLQGRSTKAMPQIFHISASEYMDWIRKAKLSFSNQPALSPEMTGIPAIRSFLYSLPAQQSLRDYESHINVAIPAFIDKIKRTVTDNDRDGGFRTIADDFDSFRKNFTTRLLTQAKSAFRDASNNSIARINSDIPVFKEQLEENLTTDWLTLRAGAFNRIVKCRGVVPKGASKAKGLEEGCHWTRELAEMLAPGFNKWFNAHTSRMKIVALALHQGLDQLHHKTIISMDGSSANMVTIEKAKRKWASFRTKLLAKLMVMVDEVSKVETLMYEDATMEFGRERNLIAYVTDDLYAEVFNAVPEEKPPLPAKSGKKKPTKRYVMSKIKFQKKKMEDLFLNPENHFVDQVFTKFQRKLDDNLNQLLDNHFAGIEKLLEELSANLRAEAPIDYRITQEGEAIRADLAQQIPDLEERARALQTMLPKVEEHEQETSRISSEISQDMEDADENLNSIIDRIEGKKRTNAPMHTKQQLKRVKTEPA